MLHVTSRNYQGSEDIKGMAFVRQKSAEYDHVDPFSSYESIPTEKDIESSLSDDHCNPTTDIHLWQVNNQTVGYNKIEWWTENDGTWLYLHLGWLLPEWRGKGIGTKMLQWSQNRIREIAHNHPTNGKGVFGSNATSTEKEATKILLDNGYTIVFSMVEMGFERWNQLEPLQLPGNYILKTATKDDIRTIWEINNSIYANRAWISVPTEEDFQEFMNNSYSDLSLWDIAWHENEIAGFVLSEIKNDRAEIKEVSVVEKFRRKGLATILLTNNIIKLKDRGISVIRLHTNGENVAGAKSLYEKVGFKHLKDFNRYRKPLD